MITPYFRKGGVDEQPCETTDGAAASDTDASGQRHGTMLDEGVHWSAAQFEVGFVSPAPPDEGAWSKTEDAFYKALAAV